MTRYGNARMLAAVLLAATVPATGAEVSPAGWYIGASAPLAFIDDTDTRTAASVVTQTGELDYGATTTTEYDAGIKLDAVLGYEFGNGWRVEGEAFYARSGVKSLTYNGISIPALDLSLTEDVLVPVDGDVQQMGLAANLWYDFNRRSKWQPYVGGGLVWIRVDQSDLRYDEAALTQTVTDSVSRALGVPPTTLPASYVARVADTDTATGYHVGVGLNYRWTERVTVHGGYRRQSTGGLTFEGSNATSEVSS